MNSLDDKLREIKITHREIVEYGGPGRDATVRDLQISLTSEAIDAIKAAFAEEGYSQTTTHLGIDDKGNVVNSGTILMSGAEWYKRFEKELLESRYPKTKLPSYTAQIIPEVFQTNYILAAARKASGLEDESE